MSEKDDLVQKINETLFSAGIHVKISGCGCCGSPWLTTDNNLTYDHIEINSCETPPETW